jgi:beta-lactam-binding protein with PASTA domain
MPVSLLGYVAGFTIGSVSGLDNTQAAKLAILPGLLGASIPSLLLTGVVAQQQAASQQPPAPQEVLLPDVTINAASNPAAITEARAALNNLGLTVQVNQETRQIPIPPNIVITEEPPAGTLVQPGSTVTLTVSTDNETPH